MRVTITEGPNRGEIWRLYTVPAGQTLATFGQQDAHWELLDGATPPPPPVDPGAIYEINWVDAVAAVQGTGDPLVENTFIKVINRPVNQSPGDPTVNYGVFAGDIILCVTNAQATVLVGSRVRENPTDSTLETETVNYDLVNDVIRRVYCPRGNDVWGDAGLAVFPFFCGTITGNYVAEGAQLSFSDNPVVVNSPSNAHEWEIRNNHLDTGAVLNIGTSDIRRPFSITNNYLEGGAEVYPFTGDGTGDKALTVSGCRIGEKAKYGNLGRIEVQLINCSMLVEFDMQPFLLGVFNETYWVGAKGETLVQFIGKTLTQLSSTFEV
ncbi:MAG TPA: hypothetical protein VEI97_02190, partial [bacterium]|nr:hypothetical protein [bacterium]